MRSSRAAPLLLVLLVTIWGLRLTIYLARRNLGKGEVVDRVGAVG